MNERQYHDHHYAEETSGLIGSSIFSRVYDRVAGDIRACTRVGRSHRVLSLGCGSGDIERRLAPHVGELVGLDISPVAIKQATAKAQAEGLLNLTFASSDASEFRSLGDFDCVIAIAFLHHLGNEKVHSVLKQARSCLRPGGVFFSADPSRRRFVRLFTPLVRGKYDQYHSPDEREIHPEELAAVAREVGFSGSTIGYVDYFLVPIAWLAPHAAPWLFGPLEWLDNALLSIPCIRGYASSFSLLARVE